MSNKTIQDRVVFACEQILLNQLYVNLTEIFKVIGLLQPIHEDDWKKGKIIELETLIQGKSSKKAEVITCLKKSALKNGLMPLNKNY